MKSHAVVGLVVGVFIGVALGIILNAWLLRFDAWADFEYQLFQWVGGEG
jgi:hypothetical protein